MKNKTSKWNPTHYRCDTCKDVIFSTYPGEFVACSCFVSSGALVHNLVNDIVELVGDVSDNVRHQISCLISSNLHTGLYVDQTEYLTRIGGNIHPGNYKITKKGTAGGLRS